MKIRFELEDKPLYEIWVEMDYDKAIALWEWMDNEKFEQLFSLSILDAIRAWAKDSDEAKNIFELIKMYTEIKYMEHMEKTKSEDTQESFDDFFLKLLSNEIKFIPLV